MEEIIKYIKDLSVDLSADLSKDKSFDNFMKLIASSKYYMLKVIIDAKLKLDILKDDELAKLYLLYIDESNYTGIPNFVKYKKIIDKSMEIMKTIYYKLK